jgi:NAD+ synthase (glutamine-hydrolysing)
MNTNSLILGQVQVEAWNPEANLKRVITKIQETPEGKLIIFPEMVIPGYMIGDDWLRNSYIKECRDMNQDILGELKKAGNSAIWGNIDFDETKKNEDGSIRKYNTAFIGEKWKSLWVHYKTLLPNYRMFDDKRYFTSLRELSLEEGKELEEYYKPFEIQIDGVRRKVGVLICEDIWNINKDYAVDPVELTKRYNPEILTIVSASPFWVGKETFRHKLLERQSQWTTLAYVNPIGTQNIGKTIHAFDGGSAVYQDGKFIKWIKDFTSNEVMDIVEEKNEIEQIYETLIYTLREFWIQTWKKKFIIGLSGWLDSALVSILLVTAIGRENVIAVNMPSKFNTNTTKDLAEELAKNLGIQYLISPIQSIVDEEISVIEATTGKAVSDFDKENIQARTRGIRLAGIAANQNALFTNNGNKDETSTGYATLYGDVAGAIAPIADLYKELQIRSLARYINNRALEYWRILKNEQFNEDDFESKGVYDTVNDWDENEVWSRSEKFFSILAGKEVIPNAIIDMKPTAELSDTQNPEKGGGDPFNYEFVWKFNWATIERKMTPEDILQSYIDGNLEEKLGLSKQISRYFSNSEAFIEEIEKIWNLQKRAFFKRIQGPAVIQLGRGSFGFDYREALNDVHFTRRYEKLKKQILEKK